MEQKKWVIEQTSLVTPIISSDSVVYGLKSTDTDGVVGWLIDNKLDVATYPTLKKAQKALSERLKNGNYSWECTVEVAPFYGFEPLED